MEIEATPEIIAHARKNWLRTHELPEFLGIYLPPSDQRDLREAGFLDFVRVPVGKPNSRKVIYYSDALLNKETQSNLEKTAREFPAVAKRVRRIIKAIDVLMMCHPRRIRKLSKVNLQYLRGLRSSPKIYAESTARVLPLSTYGRNEIRALAWDADSLRLFSAEYWPFVFYKEFASAAPDGPIDWNSFTLRDVPTRQTPENWIAILSALIDIFEDRVRKIEVMIEVLRRAILDIQEDYGLKAYAESTKGRN